MLTSRGRQDGEAECSAGQGRHIPLDSRMESGMGSGVGEMGVLEGRGGGSKRKRTVEGGEGVGASGAAGAAEGGGKGFGGAKGKGMLSELARECEALEPDGGAGAAIHRRLDSLAGPQLEALLVEAAGAGPLKEPEAGVRIHLLRTAPGLQGWGGVRLPALLPPHLLRHVGIGGEGDGADPDGKENETPSSRKPRAPSSDCCALALVLAHSSSALCDRFVEGLLLSPSLPLLLSFAVDAGFSRQLAASVCSLDAEHSTRAKGGHSGSCPVDIVAEACAHLAAASLDGGSPLAVSIGQLRELLRLIEMGCVGALEAKGEVSGDRVEAALDTLTGRGGGPVVHGHLQEYLMENIGSDAAFHRTVLSAMSPEECRDTISAIRALHGRQMSEGGAESVRALLVAMVQKGGDASLISDADALLVSDCFANIFSRYTRDPVPDGGSWESRMLDADTVDDLLSLHCGPSALVKALSPRVPGLDQLHAGAGGAPRGTGLLLVSLAGCMQQMDLGHESRLWAWAVAKALGSVDVLMPEGSELLEVLVIVAEGLRRVIGGNGQACPDKISQLVACVLGDACALPDVTDDTLEHYLKLVDFASWCSHFVLDQALGDGSDAHVTALGAAIGFSHQVLFCIARGQGGDKGGNHGVPVTSTERARPGDLLALVCEDHYVLLLKISHAVLFAPDSKAGKLFSRASGLWMAASLCTAILSGRGGLMKEWLNEQHRGVGASQADTAFSSDTIAMAAEALRRADVDILEILSRALVCCSPVPGVRREVFKAADMLRTGLDPAKFRDESVSAYAKAMSIIALSPLSEGGALTRVERQIVIKTFASFVQDESRSTTLAPAVRADAVSVLLACAAAEDWKVRGLALDALAELVGSGSENTGLGDDTVLWGIVDQECRRCDLAKSILSVCTPRQSDAEVSSALFFVTAMARACGYFRERVLLQQGGLGNSGQLESQGVANLLDSALSHPGIIQELAEGEELAQDFFPFCASALHDRQVANNFSENSRWKQLGVVITRGPLGGMLQSDAIRAIKLVHPLMEAVLRWRVGCVQMAQGGTVKWLRSLAAPLKDRQVQASLYKFAERLERSSSTSGTVLR